MHDLISRQAAIDALGEKPLAWTEGEQELGLQNQWQSDVDALNDLPSAQPEYTEQDMREEFNAGYACGMASAQSKRGRWIYGEDEYGIDGYHCDKCGFFVPWDYAHKFINYIEDYNFCPSCGAEMSEGGNDQ